MLGRCRYGSRGSYGSGGSYGSRSCNGLRRNHGSRSWCCNWSRSRGCSHGSRYRRGSRLRYGSGSRLRYGGLRLRVQLALAASLGVALGLLLVLGRSRKFFLQQAHLLTGKLGGGLVFYRNSLPGKGLDGPVDANVQVFGCL
jgi:hypothetical protein